MKPHFLNMHDRPLTKVLFHPDGDLLYTSAKDSKIYVTRVDKGELIGMFEGHTGAVYMMDITLDGKILVSAAADGSVRFWDALTGDCLHDLSHGGICKGVQLCAKPLAQNRIVTCNDRFKTIAGGEVKDRICVWEYATLMTDPEASRPVLLLEIDRALPMKATKVAWGPFDETVLSLHEEGTIFQWDALNGEEVRQVQAHRGPVTDIQFSPDRMMMVTCAKDQTVKVWHLADTIEEVKSINADRPFNTAALSPLCFHEDQKKRRYHIIAGGGQEAKDVTTSAAQSGKFEGVLFHMLTSEELGTIKGHFGPMNTVSFFPDGTGFASGGEEGYVRIYHFDKHYFQPNKWD